MRGFIVEHIMLTIINGRTEKNPLENGDYLIFGDVYKDGVLVHSFGEEGTSLFAWWVLQSEEFQYNYALLFSTIMANTYG
jgi:hypothetical protein